MSEQDTKQMQALKNALVALKQLKARVAAEEHAKREPIAVIGMGCRFPGEADSPAALWQLLENGVDAVGDIPVERWDSATYFDPNPGRPGKMYTRKGGFLSGIEAFDAGFFGISPREATTMDPQQRILLEVVWETLENAGIPADRLDGSRTGVFVGQVMNDYADRCLKSGDAEAIDAYCGTGSYASVLAGRISFFLGLQGPCLAIDTACSTSLVAVHQAVQSLRLAECDLALAGGINLLLSPAHHIYYCQLNALAPDGRCKTFDADADGFVKSEGCGMVALKRLSEAQRDGDPILALIRGSAVNHDGRSSGLTVPNGPAQVAVIRQALASAGVDPASIDYVEAHGTGTALGDPIEVQALLEALRGGEHAAKPLILGSVKTNIGHTESAAGIAGLIKTVLALQHRAIPPHLHFKKLNPRIEPGATALILPHETLPWGTTESRFAGVGSIGIGGTNAHVILQEAPRPEPEPLDLPKPASFLIPLSARGEEALRLQANAWIDYLTSPTGAITPLSALSGTLARFRTHHANRVAVEAATNAELAGRLREFLRGQPTPAVCSGKTRPGRVQRIAFLFPGQGSQWLGMGRQLLRSNSVFRDKLTACDRVCRELEGWSILDELLADASASPLSKTSRIQPALFAIQVSLAELWASLGIVAEAVIGHSMGEVAAAHVAGVLELEDAMRIICRRSHLAMQAGEGAMALVEMGASEARAAIAPFRDRLAVAAHNGPTATILSGEPEAMTAVLESLAEREIFCRRIQVDYASHGPAMDALQAPIREALAGIAPHPAGRTMYSTVLDTIVEGPELNAGYWARNLRETVLFHDQIKRAMADGFNIFLEIGPHPILTYAVEECVHEAGIDAAVLGSLRRDEDEWVNILQTLGAAYVRGYPIAWDALYADATIFPGLPNYAWHRQRYWVEPTTGSGHRSTLGSDRVLVPAPVVIRRDDPSVDETLRDDIRQIVGDFGLAPQTVGEATGKAFIFLGSTRDGLFFFNRRGHSLVALNYAGPPDRYAATAAELLRFCQSKHLECNILTETGAHNDELAQLGFSATKIGVWQEIRDLAGFALTGNKMRRLRYAVNRYRELGDCRIERYYFGSNSQIDAACFALMRTWAADRESARRLVEDLIAALSAAEEHRVKRARAYLIRRNAAIDGLVLISKSPDVKGYLLDMEFYAPDVPHGCMEFGIAGLIEQLSGEGCQCFSLGLTLGTAIDPCEGEDAAVRDFFEQLHAADLLNGDGNFQFKNKFRPFNESAYLCRPRALSGVHLVDFLTMLSDPTNANAEAAIPADFFGEQPVNDASPSPKPSHDAHLRPPLVPHRLDLASGDPLFETWADLDAAPFLADHRLAGRPVFPAAAFIEILLATARAMGKSNDLTDLVLVEILTVDQPVKLQIAVEPGDCGSDRVTLFSKPERGDTNQPWQLHVAGTLAPTSAARNGSPPELEKICTSLGEKRDFAAFYADLEQAGYEYGPAFQAVRQLHGGQTEALGLVELPQGLRGHSFGFHPALLDACLQVSIWLLTRSGNQNPDRRSGWYLPLSMDRCSLPAQVDHRLWALARIHYDQTGDTDGITADLTVLNEAGEAVGACEGIFFKWAERDLAALDRGRDHEGFGIGGNFYRIDWRRMARDETAAQPASGAWLAIGDPHGIGSAVRELKSQLGERVYLAVSGSDFEIVDEQTWRLDLADPDQVARLLGSIAPGPLQMVSLLGLELRTEPATPILAGQRVLLGSVLHLMQAMTALERESVSRLWLATLRGQAIQNGALGLGEELIPNHATLWGLAGAIAHEFPELWGGSIDFDVTDAPTVARLLMREIDAPDRERAIGYRAGKRFAPRLISQPIQARDPHQRLTLRADGTYLISGGLGALGLATAAMLAKRGAGTIVLLGRQVPKPEVAEALAAIKARCGQLVVEACDVSDRACLEAVFQRVRRECPPLRGVFHAAGVLDDGLLVQQSWSQFERVLAPKLLGAHYLHELSGSDALDHFVLFSSASALLGNPGQANYAAANAFLDGLAHFRHAQGLPALSINWGHWRDTGLTAGISESAQRQLQWLGLRGFTVGEGIAALEAAMGENHPQRAYCRFDLDGMAPELSGSPLFSELTAGRRNRSDTGASARKAAAVTLESLRASDGPRRQALMSQYLCQRVAAALGADPERLDTDLHLTQLGINSLMIMEMRNRIAADLNLNVPAVKFFRFPNVSALAQELAEAFDRDPESHRQPEPPSQGEPEPTVQVDSLSDEQVEAMLAQMLAQQGGAP